MSFTCPRCLATSHHPRDEEEGYCGRCHWHTGDPVLGSPAVLAEAEAAGAIPTLAELHDERALPYRDDAREEPPPWLS